MLANENKNESKNTQPTSVDLVGKKMLGLRIAHHHHTGRRVPIHYTSYALLFFILSFTGLTLLFAARIAEAGPPQTEQGSIGVSGIVEGSPPDKPARITTPSDNTHVTEGTLTVRGNCEASLSTEIYRNDVLAGSTICNSDGHFELFITLLAGNNKLKARTYDSLGQYGPDSEEVLVIYDLLASSVPTELPNEFLITAKPWQRFLVQKQQLTVTYTVSGGEAPYALAFDWADDGETEAVSVSKEGQYNITHTYLETGQKDAIVTASDALGNKVLFRFAVMVSQAPGLAVTNTSSNECKTGQTPGKAAFGFAATPLSCFVSEHIPRLINIAWPALGVTTLMTGSFWLGEKIILTRLRLPRAKL